MEIPWAILGPLGALAAYIAFVIVDYIVTSQRNARRARELKCQDPPVLKNGGLFGLKLLKRAIVADKERLFPLEIIRRLHDAGANTYIYSTMGATNISTAG